MAKTAVDSRSRNVFTAIAILFIVLLAVFLSGQKPASVLDNPDASLTVLYQSAILDAKTVAAYKIYAGLVPITDANDALLRDPAGRVLFVTWTGWAGYDGLVGNETVLSRETWVTASPQLADYCRQLPNGVNRTLWLEALLGLPPGNNKTRFVEMYADSSDVFRPCPDSEITDSVCGLEFPQDVTSGYRAWFENLDATSYGSNGYPWTRLGYTYNWAGAGSQAYSDKVGLSEFVIRQGATVGVAAVSSLEQYCS